MGLNDPTERLPIAGRPQPGPRLGDDPTTVLPVTGGRGLPVTRPVPVVPPEPGSTDPVTPDHRPSTPRLLAGTEAVAGLLSSGLLVVTLALVVAKIVAPLVVENAVGPQWWRIGVGAAVALPAELSRIGRRRRSRAVRAVIAVVVIVAVVVAVAFTWWW